MAATKSAKRPSVKQKDQARVKTTRVAMLLKQASDPTRLTVLTMLLVKEQNVTEICEALGSSQPAVSHHLALLRHGGLIEPRRDGKNNFYSLTENGKTLANVVAAIG